jgi:hypothetical protein
MSSKFSKLLPLQQNLLIVERVKGIEPSYAAWEAADAYFTACALFFFSAPKALSPHTNQTCRLVENSFARPPYETSRGTSLVLVSVFQVFQWPSTACPHLA